MCSGNMRSVFHQADVTHSAGFAGAFVDREVESKGLDFVDREKAKYEGKHTLRVTSTVHSSIYCSSPAGRAGL